MSPPASTRSPESTGGTPPTSTQPSRSSAPTSKLRSTPQPDARTHMKLLTVVGARPQFIKAAAFSRVVRERHTEILVHTGQHYDTQLSDVFFEELQLPKPDHHLGVGSGSHGRQTAQMLERLEAVMQRESPDCVVVYGDTNSTLAGALAAAKLGLPVAHVEAGLRSRVREMPEEINRIVTDHLSTFLFAPTKTAVENLLREGFSTAEDTAAEARTSSLIPPPSSFRSSAIYDTGDIMYDALRMHAPIAAERSRLIRDIALTPGEYVVATVHR